MVIPLYFDVFLFCNEAKKIVNGYLWVVVKSKGQGGSVISSSCLSGESAQADSFSNK